jgi:hypothetical protein
MIQEGSRQEQTPTTPRVQVLKDAESQKCFEIDVEGNPEKSQQNEE